MQQRYIEIITHFFIKNIKELSNFSQDEYIANVKKKLAYKKFNDMKKISVNYILKDIKQSLKMAGIEYNSWFFESSLLESENLKLILDYLSENNHTYVQDGATWFKSQDLGDEKDRVLVKENNDFTYLSTDIAYHKNKIERNFKKVINIWGADHHGYIPRLKGAFQIFSKNKSELIVLLVQFANLYRGKEKVSMSTRSGEFITLKENLLMKLVKMQLDFFT